MDNIDFAACMPIVARALLGEPNKALSTRHEWRYGKNGSLSVNLKTGTFFDHETKESGGVMRVIELRKGFEGADALQYMRDIGCPVTANGSTRPNEIPYNAAADPFIGATFKDARKNGNGQFHITRTWQYTDENNTELFEVCRLENGEGKRYKQRRRGADGEYIDSVKGIRQVPYKLLDLIDAVAENKTIFVVEGEKCVDAVMSLGGAATCNAMGAGKWPDELTPFFQDADVCILPDNDKAGADHAAKVLEKVRAVARRVRILELPGLPPKGDVFDWIAAGGTFARLQELAEAHAATQAPATKANVIIGSAKKLQHEVFQPMKYAVKGYVVEGVTILAGRPKIGKSWLAMDWNGAISRGGFCFGDLHCIEGPILYLALEDNKRRLKSRLGKLFGDMDWPANFEFATEWPTAKEGGIDAIRAWVKSRPGARAVTIDVLERFRTRSRSGKDNAYAADYETIKDLQSLATELNIAIIVITHLRKGGDGDDPIEKISGTLGLSGAADAFLILDSTSNGQTLYGRGRDLEEFTKAVRFNRETCRWEILGEAADVKRSDERSRILECLGDADEAMTPVQIAAAAGLRRENVRKLLAKMVADGEILKGKRGKYASLTNPGFMQSKPVVTTKNEKDGTAVTRSHPA